MTHWRAFLISSAVALVAAASFSSTALAENTCESVAGEGTVGEKLEKQKIVDSLNVSLTGPERLNFSWEGGKKRFHMQLLVRAACHAGTKASVFSGFALGMLNKEPGYAMAFTIKITSEGETFLRVKVKHKAELVEEFELEELENSTEEIA